MANARDRRTVSAAVAFPTLAGRKNKHAVFLAAVLLFAFACMAQDQPLGGPEPDPEPNQPQAAPTAKVTLPAGTRIALVLTHPIQSRYVHRGDDMYAQITSPVNADNEVVIPPGTFAQGKIDRIDRRGGRGELYLESMSITFQDGYVAPVAGPITLVSDDGYALKDPGQGRIVSAFALPAAGAGLGALIGRSVASSQNSTITSTLPPGCTGPPPGCLSSSLSVPPNRLKSTAIGSMVGLAAGGVAALVMLTGSHNFYLDEGSPVEMVLQQPLTVEKDVVGDAIRDALEETPPAPPPTSQRLAQPPDTNTDRGTCYTPGSPGTPDVVVPGVPGPDGVPGPPTTIPGTPPTPGTAYPCPL